MTTPEENTIIIYDGDCKLCQNTVKFLRSGKDSSGFRFIPSSASESDQLLKDHRIPKIFTDRTVILIDNNQVYTKSTAVIKALQKRGGIWYFTGAFSIVPVFIRDFLYDMVAKIRKL